MSNLDWKTLIAERDDWVARNFPGDNDGRQSILGCVEELGELAHAHLKEEQGIRGTPEEHQAAAQDAIGDLTVYLLGVMSAHMKPSRMVLPRTGHEPITADESLFLLAYNVGSLAYFAMHPLLGTSNWRITVNNVLKFLEAYCCLRDWDFDAIVTKTWDHVKQRDWNKHRAEGAKADDPSMKDPTL